MKVKLLVIALCLLFIPSIGYSKMLGMEKTIDGVTIDEFTIDSFYYRSTHHIMNVIVKLYYKGQHVGYKTVNIYGNTLDDMINKGFSNSAIEEYIYNLWK